MRRVTAAGRRPRIAAASITDADRLTLVGHLEELRRRLGWTLAALLVATIVAFAVHGHLLDLLDAPLPASAPDPVTLGVAEPFTTSLRISFWAALALTMPFASWQLWAFVAPAFGAARRRTIVALVAASTVLFAAGGAFGYFVALPQSLAFLVNYDAHHYSVQLRASELYRFNALVLLACGAVFQLPIVLLGLVRFRVIDTARLRRNRRVGWAVVAALAVLMPGVDPILTGLTFIPLVVLYEGTVLVATILERRWSRARTSRTGDGHDLDDDRDGDLARAA